MIRYSPIFLILLFSISKSDILNVPGDYDTIQDAIDSSTNNDSVIVSPGVYYEKINFQGKSIFVSSRFILDNDSLLIGLTVIDAQNTGSVVTFNSEETNLSIIQGFTIQGGNGNYEDPDDNDSYYNYGGGIYCENSSPLIKDCIIQNNTGDEGGGGGVFCYNSSPKFYSCSILNNETDDLGGGVYAKNNSSPEFYNSVILGNIAEFGGGCYFRDQSSPLLENVILMENFANNSGGGMSIKDNVNLYVSLTQIKNNSTDGIGGGVYIRNSNPTFNYSLIINNTSSSGGAGYIRNESYVHFTNVTIANNSADLYGAAFYMRDASSVIISNSILWDHAEPQVYFRQAGEEVSLDILYTTFENGLEGIEDNGNGEVNWGVGNLEDEPLFCNAPAENYYIRDSSPCVDGGIGGSLMGCFESGCGSIIWYIDSNGSDTNDGTLEAPFETINRAMDIAIDGDTIRLSPGNYFGSINFEGKEIVLESRAFELEDTSLIAETSILSGPLEGSCLILTGSQNNNGTLRGLTFKGGSDINGGGIKIENCSPTLSDLIIEDNNAENGGGLYLSESDAVLKNLIIRNNTANLGGGLYVVNGEPYIENITLDNNISYWGGGAYFKNSNPILHYGKVLNNQSFIEGAGIYVDGGFFNLYGISFEYNNAYDFGGGLVAYEAMIDINQATFVSNISGIGSVFAFYSSLISLKNSIIWGNSGPSLYIPEAGGLTTIGIQYTNIEGGESILDEFSNIILNDMVSITDMDPFFCDFNNNIFSLSIDSPCRFLSEDNGIIGAYFSECEMVSLDQDKIELDRFELSQNYPNPFNPETTINFFVPMNISYELYLFNLQGQLVKLLHKGIGKNQNISIDWDATNNLGQKVPSGIYIGKLETDKNSKNIKMLLLK